MWDLCEYRGVAQVSVGVWTYRECGGGGQVSVGAGLRCVWGQGSGKAGTLVSPGLHS